MTDKVSSIIHTKSRTGKAIKIPGPDHPITISPAEGRVRVTVARQNSCGIDARLEHLL